MRKPAKTEDENQSNQSARSAAVPKRKIQDQPEMARDRMIPLALLIGMPSPKPY